MNTFLRKGIALTLVACSIFTNTSLGNLKPFKPTVVKASEIKNDKKVQKTDKKEIKVLPNDENVETKEGKQLLIKDEKNGEILGNFKKAYDVKYQGSTYILEYKNEKTAKKDEKEFTKEKRNVEINETFDVNDKEKTISDETKDENEIQVSEENDKKEEKQQIIVAVIDSGVDLSNEKLNTRLAKSSKENFVRLSDEDIQNKFYSDELGHGTKIAKLIAENTDSNVSILPIKVTDDKNQTNTLKLYNGIKSAIDSNVDVINISLNGKGKSKLIDNAIKEATEKGIVVVVSAGNNGEDTKEYIPSSTKEAIVVSSKDTNISNHGDEIDYCAEDSYVGEKGSVSVGTSYSTAYVTASVAKVLEKTTLSKDKDRVKNLQLELDRFTSKVEESSIKSEETEKYFGRGYLEPNKITDELIAQYENELGFAKLKEKAKKEEKKAKQNTDKVNTDNMNFEEESEEVIRLKASGSSIKKSIQFQIYDAGDASSFGVEWRDDGTGQNTVYRSVSMPNKYGYNFDNEPLASSIPGGGVIQVNMHPELDHVQYKSSLEGTNTLTVYYGNIESSVIDGHGVTPYFWMNTVKNGAEPVMIKDYTDDPGFPRFSNGADDNTNGRGTKINGKWKYDSKWDRRWTPQIKQPSGDMFQIYMYTGVGFYEAHQRIHWWSSHNVHYDGNGGEYPGGAPSDFTKESGQTPNISSKIPQKHGYDFEGYNITGDVKGSLDDQKRDGKGLVHPNEAYTHDQNGGTVVLKAQYDPWKYNINYDGNGANGSVPSSQVKIFDKDSFVSRTIPLRDGYVFCGWISSWGGGINYAPGDRITDAQIGQTANNQSGTLKAKWRPIEYDLMYDDNPGVDHVSGTTSPIQTITYDRPFTVRKHQSTCYYDVTFKTNGSTILPSSPDSTDRYYGKFIGWAENSTGTGKVWSEESTAKNIGGAEAARINPWKGKYYPTGSVHITTWKKHLYAKWNRVNTVTLKNATRRGCKIVGWSEDKWSDDPDIYSSAKHDKLDVVQKGYVINHPDNKPYIVGKKIDVDRDTTYYAVWDGNASLVLNGGRVENHHGITMDTAKNYNGQKVGKGLEEYTYGTHIIKKGFKLPEYAFDMQYVKNRFDKNLEREIPYTYKFSQQGWSFYDNVNPSNDNLLTYKDTSSKLYTFGPHNLTVANGYVYKITDDFVSKTFSTRHSTIDFIEDSIRNNSATINGDEVIIKMYAILDKYPILDAYDLTISKKDIDEITDEWLLKTVENSDREDNKLPNKPNHISDDLSVTVLPYDKNDFKNLDETGGVSITYRAVDGVGNTTDYTVTVYVISQDPDTTKEIDNITPSKIPNLFGETSNNDRYIRGISEKYYDLGNKDSRNYINNYTKELAKQKGGLEVESLWYVDGDFKSTIEKAFSNIKNNSPTEVWYFTQEDKEKAKEFIKSKGLGKLNKDYKANNTSKNLEDFATTFKDCKQK